MPDVVVGSGCQCHRGHRGGLRHGQDEPRPRSIDVQILRGEVAIGGVGRRVVGRGRPWAAGHRDPGPATEAHEDLVLLTGHEAALDIRGNERPGVLAAVGGILRLAELEHAVQIGQAVDPHQNPPHGRRFAEEVVGKAHAYLVLTREAVEVQADLPVTGARNAQGPQRDGLAARIALIVSFD